MDAKTRIKQLQDNIAEWTINLEQQKAIKNPSPKVQSTIEGIEAGIARDQAELDVLLATDNEPTVEQQAILKAAEIAKSQKVETMAQNMTQEFAKSDDPDALAKEKLANL